MTPDKRGCSLLVLAGSAFGWLCGPLGTTLAGISPSLQSCRASFTVASLTAVLRGLPTAATHEPGVCGEQRWAGCAQPRLRRRRGTSLQLSHELCLHGKYERLWTGSRHRGYHCSGFRPSIWARPAWPLSRLPGSLNPTTFLAWEMDPGEHLAWPALPPPFQIPLPEASEELRPWRVDVPIPVLHAQTPLHWRGRGRRGRPLRT